MWPLLLCSVLAVGIILERAWSLRQSRIAPKKLVAQAWHWQKQGELNPERIRTMREGSALGRILAVGLTSDANEREVMKQNIEDVGRHVAHELGRFLNTLGTIASITPLLGLLGTVIGMIKVFSVITTQGIGDPSVLAEGISEALVTTAAGLSVAIPTLMFYRYYRGKVEDLVLTMEQESMRLVDVLHARTVAQKRKPASRKSASQTTKSK